MDEINVHPVKVFGLQRTGTNLMQALLCGNFHVAYLDEKISGWKHGPLRLPGGSWNGRPARFVLCVKNPYAWAVSCYRYFQASYASEPTTPPQFQQDPSVSFEEFAITPSYSFQTPIHRWNQMNRLWLSTLPADQTLLVRQEDQIHSQLEILQEAEQKLGLVRRATQFDLIEERVDVNARLRGSMNRGYYVDRQYLSHYSPTLLDRVNSLIDPSLMERFNYPRERWAMEHRQIGPIGLVVRPCTTDAADAHRLARDPYRFLQVKQRGDNVQTLVDAGAGIGASVLLAKGMWPQARVTACEICPAKVALLRMNTRHLANVTVHHAAVSDAVATSVPIASICHEEGSCCVQDEHSDAAHSTVPTTSLQRMLDDLGQIDLLKISSPESFNVILQHAVVGGYVKRIHWICARLPTEVESQSILEQLSQTHAVETWSMPSGRFFLARLGA